MYVKREDLAVKPPAPPFSKVRGLMKVLRHLKNTGIEAVGYTETSVSMAGWGVAWGCHQLGLRAVLFDPQYKTKQPLLELHRKHWDSCGAERVPIPAGRAKVGFYQSRKMLAAEYGLKGVMLPLGLPFPETIEETHLEAERTLQKLEPRTVVVNVGSGTIMAGLLRGFPDAHIIGVLGRSGSIASKRKDVERKAQRNIGGLLGVDATIVDPGWEYTERCEAPSPFPCHPWYDLKAWDWLTRHAEHLDEPVLFWNIGQMGRVPKEGGLL